MPIYLIIGAGGFIGSALCKKLLDKNYFIHAFDIDVEKLDRLKRSVISDRLTTKQIDVSVENSLKDALLELQESNTFFDGIAFCTGIDSKVTEIHENSQFTKPENTLIENWNNEILHGLTNIFLIFKHFSPIIAQNGSLVLVSSDLSVISPDHRLYNDDELIYFKPISYSVVKTALVGLTKYLANYLAPRKIRVNAISPGGIENNQNQIFQKKLAKLIPMGRMAEINEITSVISFLLSPESSYITGQNIICDGGRSII